MAVPNIQIAKSCVTNSNSNNSKVRFELLAVGLGQRVSQILVQTWQGKELTQI